MTIGYWFLTKKFANAFWFLLLITIICIILYAAYTEEASWNQVGCTGKCMCAKIRLRSHFPVRNYVIKIILLCL